MVTAAMLFADEAVQRRLGDAAFYAGDYPNAISSYVSALELADRENKPDGWAASALNLGVAYLHNGDIARARQIHDEFCRRYPLRSAGTLPGDLLAAEGKYIEAEKFFKSLLANNPEMADATRFSLGMLYLKTKKFSSAYDVFTKLAAKESPWQNAALNERLYALICLKRYSEALAVIGGIPPAKRNADVELMLYLAEVYSGKTSNLEKNFNKFLEKMPPSPHLRLMELLAQASTVARKAGNYDFASRALYQALSFSVDSRTRRELHKMLVETLMAYSLPDAAEQARKYALTYPSAADRMQVISSVANAQKDPSIALKLYMFVIQGQFTMAEKIAAAKAAVALAEKTKNFAELKKINDFLIANLPLEESVDYQCRYAAFLEAGGKYDLTLAQLNDAVKRAGTSGKLQISQKPMVKLMEFYWRNNDPEAVSKLAGQLAASPVSAYAYSAKMAQGQILDKNGDYERAREKFIEAAKIAPAGVAEAKFQAALMAKKADDFATAAPEFMELAEKYPDFAKTPEALFMAADLFSTINAAGKANHAAALLQKKYSNSSAFAALILRNAAEKGNAGDIDGALKELKELEKKFSSSPVADDAALLQGIFLARKDAAAAIQIFSRLRNSGKKQLAAESGWRLGDLLFRRGDLTGAYDEFIRSAEQEPGTLVSDVAYGRAGDCLLAGKMPLPQANISGALKIFQNLAESSKFSQIRLQALFKSAVAFEYMGERAKALEAYEKTVYWACEMNRQGVTPDSQWCVRAVEAALRLIAENRVPGALQRGLRLIELSNDLLLWEGDFSERMRKSFRQQLK